MDSNEFRELLQTKSDRQLLGLCLHDATTPYVFQPNLSSWDAFRDELTLGLGVEREDIRIVGSGRLGFSTKPYNNLGRFTHKSDIDVLIVNAHAFDELWMSLLKAAYPRGAAINKLGGWLKDRKNEVYTGWITPLGIHINAMIFGQKASQVLYLKSRWFDALKKASKHPSKRHEDVNGRLYRTWEHAELYHLNSLASLRKSLD